MGIIRGMMGHYSPVDLDKLQDEFAPLMIEGEEMLAAYKTVRDMFIFTNKRFILCDKQGVTAQKTSYETIPYTSIVRFAKESASVVDLDAELKIWIIGMPDPIVKEFKRDGSVNGVYQILTEEVLRRKG